MGAGPGDERGENRTVASSVRAAPAASSGFNFSSSVNMSLPSGPSRASSAWGAAWNHGAGDTRGASSPRASRAPTPSCRMGDPKCRVCRLRPLEGISQQELVAFRWGRRWSRPDRSCMQTACFASQFCIRSHPKLFVLLIVIISCLQKAKHVLKTSPRRSLNTE